MLQALQQDAAAEDDLLTAAVYNAAVHGDELVGGAAAKTKQTRNAKLLAAQVTAETLAAHNKVTSLTNPPREKARAQREVEKQNNLANLPSALTEVTMGSLYFVRSSAAEGELHVGLALALAETTDPSSEVNVRWFVRNEWAKAKRHAWSFNPVFIIAGDPMNQQKRYETKEKLSHFCPVPVALTKTCIKEKKQLTQPKLQRIVWRCYVCGALRTVCALWRPHCMRVSLRVLCLRLSLRVSLRVSPAMSLTDEIRLLMTCQRRVRVRPEGRSGRRGGRWRRGRRVRGEGDRKRRLGAQRMYLAEANESESRHRHTGREATHVKHVTRRAPIAFLQVFLSL